MCNTTLKKVYVLDEEEIRIVAKANKISELPENVRNEMKKVLSDWTPNETLSTSTSFMLQFKVKDTPYVFSAHRHVGLSANFNGDWKSNKGGCNYWKICFQRVKGWSAHKDSFIGHYELSWNWNTINRLLNSKGEVLFEIPEKVGSKKEVVEIAKKVCKLFKVEESL